VTCVLGTVWWCINSLRSPTLGAFTTSNDIKALKVTVVEICLGCELMYTNLQASVEYLWPK